MRKWSANYSSLHNCWQFEGPKGKRFARPTIQSDGRYGYTRRDALAFVKYLNAR